MNEKVTDKARGMFEKATGWVFCTCVFGFVFGFVVRYTCFPLFDILVFHCSIYMLLLLVGGEVEDVGMLIGFGHLGNMCRISSRTRGWMARWIGRSGWWGGKTWMEGWGACGKSLGG